MGSIKPKQINITNGKLILGTASAPIETSFTFPSGNGSPNQILRTNGTGTVSWSDESSGGASTPDVTVNSPNSSPYNITHDNTVTEDIFILTPGQNTVVNLPDAATCGKGYKYQIKNMSSSHSLTITPDSGDTIDTASSFVLNTEHASVTIVTDGNNWFII